MTRLSLLAAGACVLFAGVAAYVRWNARAHTFPLFEERSAANWQAYGGDWALENGIYTDRVNGRGDKLVGGPQNYGNYSVATDLRFDTEPGDPRFGDAGLLLRVQNPRIGVDAHQGYYAALRLDDHALIIGAMNFSFRELATTPFPHAIHAMHWYRLTFTARECTFHVQAEDLQTREGATLSYVEHDCSPIRGQVGVRSYYSRASWRDLQVHLLS